MLLSAPANAMYCYTNYNTGQVECTNGGVDCYYSDGSIKPYCRTY